MATKTDQLQQVCNDLVDLLKERLKGYEPNLVELLGQQYFMGTLARLISLSKQMEAEGRSIEEEPYDITKQDLYFSLTYPEGVDPIQVDTIRKESAKIMASCIELVKNDLISGGSSHREPSH